MKTGNFMGNPRQVAYDLLKAVSVDGAYANLELPNLIRKAKLDSRDAGFATELGMGTLRWLLTLDLIIEAAADRPIEKIDPPLRDALRLGAYQLLLMRVPSHAAVDTTVRMVAELGLRSATGFANAVLRKIDRQDLTHWQAQVSKAAPTEVDALSFRWAHPRWQVAALRDALGERKSTLSELLEVNNQSPQITLVNRAGGELQIDSTWEPGRWSPLAYKVKNDPATIPAIASGQAGIQDEGSQLLVLTFLAAPMVGSDQKFIDICAGPGGKSALMRALRPDVSLTAVELQPHRAQLVEQNLQGLSGETKVLIADGTDSQFATGDYDRVFIDAPCTGLGVLRRRAESRHRRSPKDVGSLSRLQTQLLENAMRAVRPGGLIAYATCSPHLAETEFVVEDAMKGREDFELLNANQLALEIPDLQHAEEFARLAESGPYLRLWPHLHDTDGMFLALLRRKS